MENKCYICIKLDKKSKSMKHTFLLFSLVALLCGSCRSMEAATEQSSQSDKVKLGIEVLRDRHFDVLQGKRVGLVTNPTGVDSKLKSTVDILHEAPEVNLVALYGPEHGVRGNVHAGDHVDNEVDSRTGIQMFSLYGATRKPTKEMMEAIDVLVYDIQDNGCRSYTYISTLGMLMEACAEYDKELVVLDRPNPLGGKIEGNLAEVGYISFVSQFKIPYLYGQTCGELALMLNAEADESNAVTGKGVDKDGALSKACKLTVVPMEGWKHSMNWEQTGLEWVVASPHVPSGYHAYFYPTTGILGEFGYFNIGVGYTMPFQLLGTMWINAEDFADEMNKLCLPGLVFRPIHYKPFYSVGKGEQLQGVQIHIMDFAAAQLSEVQFWMLQVLNKMYPEHNFFEECDKGRFRMFDQVCGTGYIREEMGKDYDWSRVRAYWNKDVEAYRERSRRFYLYE